MNAISILNAACEKLAVQEYPGYEFQGFESSEMTEACEWLKDIMSGKNTLGVSIIRTGIVSPVLNY
jgi:hypothetical protein